MVATFFNPNAPAYSQVDSLTVGGAPVAGNTISATINSKAVTYTVVTGDTTSTAAAGLQALLSASTAPPEFAEVNWTVSSAVVTGTAATPGSPFTLTASAAGAATLTRAAVTANSSPSDAANAANWLRNGVAALPQNGDDVTLADSSVPLLWNLNALAAVMFNSLTRWQSMTGQIGLPEVNATGGYQEYRPQYFQFSTVGGSGSGGLSRVLLGAGQSGSGPSLEKYQAASAAAWTVLASGSPSGDYAVRILTGGASTLLVTSAAVGVAMLNGETSALASATVDGGGSLALGAGCSVSGTLRVKNGSVFLMDAPASLVAEQGSQATVNSVGLTHPDVQVLAGSSVSWLSDSTITSLTLQDGSTFDKSGDVRPVTVVSSAIDADCLVLDPNNCLTFTNRTTVRGAVQSGPFVFGTGRSVLWV